MLTQGTPMAFFVIMLIATFVVSFTMHMTGLDEPDVSFFNRIGKMWTVTAITMIVLHIAQNIQIKG